MDKKNLLQSMNKIIYSLLIIEFGLGLITFSNRVQHHQKVLKLFAPSSGPYFFIYHYVTRPLNTGFELLSQNISYPAALILTVALVRLGLSLLSVKSFYAFRIYNLQMQQLKPQLNLIDDTLLNEPLTPAQCDALNQQRHLVLRANNVTNPYKWMIYSVTINVIVMNILYQLIAYNTHLQKITVCNVNLGSQSVGLTMSVAFLYLINELLTVLRTNQPKYLIIVTPGLIFVASYFMPAVIVIYWLIGALISFAMNFFLLFYSKTIKLKNPAKIIIDQNSINLITKKDLNKHGKEKNSNNPIPY